jgi:flagellum-specific peptidoglycan hydrolase FlgJ
VGITVAQAALESNFGESQLSRTANNYFGIKAHGNHAVMEFRTNEFDGEREGQVVARFAAYETMEECFQCRDRLIAKSSVYADARVAKGDPERFVKELAKHWATDPKYAQKVLRIYAENNLGRFD